MYIVSMYMSGELYPVDGMHFVQCIHVTIPVADPGHLFKGTTFLGG